MKNSIKKLFSIMFCLAFAVVAYGTNINAATNRHYCIKYTCNSTYYGITADIYLPSSIYTPSYGGYCDWYLGMDPTSGSNAVEGGISYKQGTFHIFLNTGADHFSYTDSSIRLGQKVNIKIRLSSDGSTATLYKNGSKYGSSLKTGATFRNGKGYPKMVMGVQDDGSSYHNNAIITNAKACANSAGSSYTSVSSSMVTPGKWAPNGGSNPYSSTSFPLSASLNSQA